MKYIHSLKQKSILVVAIIISITILVTYSVLSFLYFDYHEQQVKTKLTILLQDLGQHPEHVNKAVEWLDQNVDITLYLFEDVEELLANLPFETNRQDIFSTQDLKQLANGQTVVNKMAITHLQVPILTFTYPILEDGKIEQLLFIYYPINHPSSGAIILMAFLCIFTFGAAGVIFILTKKIFGNAARQLKDIKQAAINISKGNYDTKVWTNSTDEVGEISEVFNMMADALKDNQRRGKEFLEDISHELKTPLAHISTYNQALMDGVIQDDDEKMKSYQLIDRETIRLQKLIQNFLDFTKLDAHAVELNQQPIVFAQSIEEIMMKYKRIFTQKNMQLNMSLNYDVIVHADEERIEQIIQNIIQNAIRYTKAQPGIINITLDKQATSCVLSIADNGIGISEEHLAIITNRFVRVNKVQSRHESGTGIGLSIVEKLMDLHGGEMIIESQLDVGTTIKLIFPLYEESEA